MFQVRIHNIDYCLAAPTKADQAASRAPIKRLKHNKHDKNDNDNNEPRVPIIRVFGASSAGQIACVHIHGVFPYLFVPYELPLNESDKLIASLRHGIDQAIGRTTVLAITVVRGIPFYGFHVGFRLFLKIYLVDPSQITRVAEMLRQGRIAGVPVLLPHESHIPFLLQFMTDYNLYGCDLLKASNALVRSPDDQDLDHDDRKRSCPLQVDIYAHHIRNRDAVPERRQHEDIPELPTDPNQRLVYSMAALWREMAAQYDKEGQKSEEARKAWEMVSTQEAFAQLAASSSDPRRTPSPWPHEDEYREQIADMIAAEGPCAERPSVPRPPLDELEECLPTIRQSVEDFYPADERSDNKNKEEWGEENDVPVKVEKEVAPAQTEEAEFLSPSPDFELLLGELLDKHEKSASGVARITADSTWMHSQRSQPRRSQERLAKKKQQKRNAAEGHRPLSQTFSVVKSAFPRAPQKKAASPAILSDDEDGIVIPSTPDYELEQLSTPRRQDKNPQRRNSAVPLTPDADDEDEAEPIHGEPHVQTSFYPVSNRTVAFAPRPPDADDVIASLGRHGPDEIHTDAHFSQDADGHTKGGGLPDFAPAGKAMGQQAPLHGRPCSIRAWEMAEPPPSYGDVAAWLVDEEDKEKDKQKTEAAVGESMRRRMDAARRPKAERACRLPFKAAVELDMRTLVLEVHANSRERFLPNPERDAVQGVFWKAAGGSSHAATRCNKEGGAILVDRPLQDGFPVEVVADEGQLLQRVVQLVHDLDPDVLAGYETSASSWGYLAERAALHDVDLWGMLSRVRQARVAAYHERGQLVTGRHVLSIGQAMRADLDLRQYTLEAAAWHVLGRRVPSYRPHVLTSWASSGRARDVSRLAGHYRQRAAIGLALLEVTGLVLRTCEQARVLGVDFVSVLERGSQFKVESVMLRVAKPENYVLPSPSHEQVGQQKAAACQPLVLEPRSAFYSSPVVVLDFTSLYPSLMIAYNLCYSTFVGRLDPLYHEKKAQEKAQENTVHPDAVAEMLAKHREATEHKMGFMRYARPPGLLARLAQLGLVVSPTGMMYVSAQTRQSLLAKMLAEILDTRAMVKAAMKRTTTAATTAANRAGERQRLHNRQLALKLLANVTYGYTSASFSGRMPCVEVADSIVQTGRQTLDRAIALIHAESRWKAEVVYGDTDSLFVHLPGRTREQAFAIGAEMAEAVTASNPHPVRLKFEKVYHPCVLLAKKRYVGYAFDAPDTLPVFDAKGIETVRRDGSPASAKMLEESLRILFDSADLTRVKTYLQARFDDLVHGRVSLADLCFARAVRAPGSYRVLPPGALVAARRAARDPRAALLVHGERVPYVVVAGPPGSALRDRCVAPEEVVRNRHLRIDSDYYIRHSLLPPLDRVLRLVGVDVARWYGEMPRPRMPLQAIDPAPPPSQAVPPRLGQQTLDTWLRGTRCARCGRPVKRRRQWRPWRQPAITTPAAETPVLCRSCGRDHRGTLLCLQERARDAEAAHAAIERSCRSCAGLGPRNDAAVRCENLGCPAYYVRAERALAVRIERAKAPLVAALARRGMQDLEW